MTAHATEEHVISEVTSRDSRRELREAVLPRGPAPDRQRRCNGARDTTPPTLTGERCFLLSPFRRYINRPTELTSVRTPRGGGLEYLHFSPAGNRWRRKGTPVPGGYKYGDLAVQVGGVSNLRQ
jgi:hypothetical protein